MSKQLEEVVCWNRFVRDLLRARKHWLALQEVLEPKSRVEVEKMPMEAQRFLSKEFAKTKFDIMLPALVSHWRNIGGLEELLISAKEEQSNGGK